ncbi:MAG: HNH endonuclease signature motif containing protein [Parabacteroides sp.]|nr:HNH endonuclease signature motif containing protein [Parabacteroides sp.]
MDKLREERAETTKKRYNKRYNKERDPKYSRFYNSPAWRALSARYMQDHKYTCEECNKIATQVHHKTPIQTDLGWDLRYDYDNLEALCDRCHNKAHKRFGF